MNGSVTSGEMSTVKPSTSSPRPSGDEETLPLYEEFNRAESSNAVIEEVDFPDDKASPDEVRDFLMNIFMARRIPLDHARRGVARWTIGSGRELRTYSAAMYLSIFGLEDGWLLYKEMQVRQNRHQKKKKTYKLGEAIAFTTLLVIEIALVTASVFLPLPVGVFTILFSIIFGVFLLTFGVVLAFAKGPEDSAEDELRRAVAKHQVST